MPAILRLVAHVFLCFWKQKNIIVSTFVPNTILGSNAGTGLRFERCGLARQWSRHPSAMGKKIHLLRRQMLGSFVSERETPSQLPPKEATHLLTLPKGVAISYRASPQRSKRRPVPAFEPGILFGTKVETKIN
jgi:hypothetical protein